MADPAPAILERHVRQARFAATAAVFGSVWGAAEMTVGAVLHAARLPFAGLVLTGLGLVVALSARRAYPARYLVLAVGTVAAVLKLFSFAASPPLSASVAILCEAALAEAVLFLPGNRRWSFALAGAVAGLFPLPHLVLGQALLFGGDVLVLYARMLRWGATLTGLPEQSAALLVAVLAAIHATWGGLAGLVAWAVSGAAMRRLGREDR